ncbi:MAG: hypothetical protein ABIP80_01965 [Ferruginibacter sp.]
MQKDIRRGIIIPAFLIMLMVLNFTRIKHSENVRAIHVVTLLGMGFALGVLLMNLLSYLKNKKIQEQEE